MAVSYQRTLEWGFGIFRVEGGERRDELVVLADQLLLHTVKPRVE